jgi:hypothetical protein
MKLNVQYVSGEPKTIITDSHSAESEFQFTIEGDTARLVDVRTNMELNEGWSALNVSELNTAHDAILRLPFIDRVTVWMKGRTDTTFEDETDE